MPGRRPRARPDGHRGTQRGASAIEFALAAPVLLLLGLSALQWALVFHARQAIEHAAIEAARAGSLGNALPHAIETGLARGLLPYWSTLPDIRAAGPDRSVAVVAAQARLQQARSAGWVMMRRISPTQESFADWAEPALDGWGRPLPGTLEIPNDGLMFAEHRMPLGGASAMHLGLPVGASSGQTLLDANLLKIEIVYGVPMTVPLVGRVAAAVARVAGGCQRPERGGCTIHEAPDALGRAVPRWPVATVATVRMQSPARQTDDVPTRASLPEGRGSGGGGAGGAPEVPIGRPGTPGISTGIEGAVAPPLAGEVSPPDAFRVPGGRPGDHYGGLAASRDGSLVRADSGWLSLGSDRVFSVPGACVAH